jgi:hypothetical protein
MNQPDPGTVITSVVTPIARIVRTALQLLVGLAATIPLAVVAFDLDAEETAKVTAMMAFIVGVLSVVQNVIEKHGGRDTPALGTPVQPTTTR